MRTCVTLRCGAIPEQDNFLKLLPFFVGQFDIIFLVHRSRIPVMVSLSKATSLLIIIFSFDNLQIFSQYL